MTGQNYENSFDKNQNSESLLNTCRNKKFIENLNSYGTDFSLLRNDPEFCNCDENFLFSCYKDFMRNKMKFTKKLCKEQNKINEIVRIFKEKDKYKAEVVLQGNKRILGIEELKINQMKIPILLKDLEFRIKQQLSYIKDLYGEMLGIGAIEREFLENDMKDIEIKNGKHEMMFDKIVAENEIFLALKKEENNYDMDEVEIRDDSMNNHNLNEAKIRNNSMNNHNLNEVEIRNNSMNNHNMDEAKIKDDSENGIVKQSNTISDKEQHYVIPDENIKTNSFDKFLNGLKSIDNNENNDKLK